MLVKFPVNIGSVEKQIGFPVVVKTLSELGHHYVMGRDFKQGLDCLNRSIDISNKFLSNSLNLLLFVLIIQLSFFVHSLHCLVILLFVLVS